MCVSEVCVCVRQRHKFHNNIRPSTQASLCGDNQTIKSHYCYHALLLPATVNISYNVTAVCNTTTNQSTCSTVMLPIHEPKTGTAIHALVYAIHLDVLRRFLHVLGNRTSFFNLKRWPPLIKFINSLTQSIQPDCLLFTSSVNKWLLTSSDTWHAGCCFRTSKKSWIWKIWK